MTGMSHRRVTKVELSRWRRAAWRGFGGARDRTGPPRGSPGGAGWELVELVGDNGGVADLSEVLAAAGVRPGDLVGLALDGALAADGALAVVADAGEPLAASEKEVGKADREVRPRWVMWSQETARALTGAGIRLATC